jgi:hypothetical protein
MSRVKKTKKRVKKRVPCQNGHSVENPMVRIDDNEAVIDFWCERCSAFGYLRVCLSHIEWDEKS